MLTLVAAAWQLQANGLQLPPFDIRPFHSRNMLVIQRLTMRSQRWLDRFPEGESDPAAAGCLDAGLEPVLGAQGLHELLAPAAQ